jgi:hypothetical protein
MCLAPSLDGQLPSLSSILLMRLSISSAPASPRALAFRIAFAVKGEILATAGLRYGFFDSEVVHPPKKRLPLATLR